MRDQILYILAFKDEPLIKVGIAEDVSLRVKFLGSSRFDFTRSYLVTSNDKPCIRILERNLKTFYSAHQVNPENPMLSGNTETFNSSVLPGMLQSIHTFRDTFPHAGFQLQHDISALISAPSLRLPQEPHHPRGDTPRLHKLLEEAHTWCGQERGRQTRLAQLLGVSPQAISAWWTEYKGKQPTAEQALALEEFLRRARRRKK